MFKSKAHANNAVKNMFKILPGKWKLTFIYDYPGRSRGKKCYFNMQRGNTTITQYSQRSFYVSIKTAQDRVLHHQFYGASGFSLRTAMITILQEITDASNRTKIASNKIERLIEQLSK